MFLMRKHEKFQRLVLIGVQMNDKILEAFYQTPSVHTNTLYMMKCMNVVKSALNTWSKCHKGPTSKANQQKKLKKKNLIQKI